MMKPYYQDEWVTIYHGDCREILPQLDVKVDLVLTDPPYGLGKLWQGGGGTSKSSWKYNPKEAQSWDIPVDLVIELPNICSEVVIWGGNNYLLPTTRCWLIWDKLQPDTWTTGQAELAWTSFDRPIRVFRMAMSQRVHSIGRGMQCHPTQKPLELMSWCFKWSQTTGLVLDPFMGSGTTLIAAKKLNRKSIGIEIEEKYCEIAAKRCSQGVFNLNV